MVKKGRAFVGRALSHSVFFYFRPVFDIMESVWVIFTRFSTQYDKFKQHQTIFNEKALENKSCNFIFIVFVRESIYMGRLPDR